MAYQFLYRTNEMFDNLLIQYITDLLNADEKLTEYDKKNTKDVVVEMLSYLTNAEGKEYLWDRIEAPESEEYISHELTIEDAIVDFFNTDIYYDLNDLDHEVEIVNKKGERTDGKMIDITKLADNKWTF